MKLTRRELRKLIREMYSPNVEFMSLMSDIGSPMVKQLAKYLIPYKDRIKFDIIDHKLGIDVEMHLDEVVVGYIGADFTGDMCSNCYVVGMASTVAGEIKSKFPLYGFRKDLVHEELFRSGSYGPILYELCLELASARGPDTYITCDKHSLKPDAYNVWAYYLNNRPDVIVKQLDPEGIPVEFRITPNDPTDDCINDTSEEYYQLFTQNLVHPQGPDDDPEGMYAEYVDYVKSMDPIMKGYRKNSTPFLDLIKSLGMIK